jgi:flagellar motor switch protein FliG
MAGSAVETAIGRDARMRRVAILLSSLPAPIAGKLLGTIDPASKQSLRRTMTTLSDVDPMERHRVIEAFRVSIGRQSTDQFAAMNDEGDTFESSSQSGASKSQYGNGLQASPVLKNASPESTSANNDADQNSPLAFLADVDDQSLADLLKDEHPQAVALVLASVPPQTAGRVLSLLPDQLRSQTISRIGRLGEIPTEAAADLATHFRSRIGENPSTKSNATGQRKLDAILASMPKSDSSSQSHDPVQTTQSATPSPDGRSDAEVSAIDLSHRLRVVSEDAPNTKAQTAERPANVDAPPTTNPANSTLGSTDAIHDRLLSLSPTQLCQSLARVETREAMLCLCGLPNPVAEAALAMLPKGQAKTVREQINGLSALNLRDIDNAKESVAQASMMFTDKSQRAMAA